MSPSKSLFLNEDPTAARISFLNWYRKNTELVHDLENWLFYKCAASEGYTGDVEFSLKVEELAMYVILFYLSSLKENRYSFETSYKDIDDILEMGKDGIKDALNYLQDHHMIHYHEHGDHLHITIEPVVANHEI